MLAVTVLIIVYILYSLTIWYTSNQRSVYMILFFFTLIMFFTPVIYYELGFDVYRHSFSDESYNEFVVIAIFVGAVQALILLIISNSKFVLAHSFFTWIKVPKKLNLAHIYFILSYFFFVAYIILFRDKLPLYVLFTTSELLERPDKIGGVPLFFTVSSLYMVLAPSAFLYFNGLNISKHTRLFLLILTCIILLAGGHKGIIAFFLIFVWFYVYKAKISLSSAFLFLALILVYALTKGHLTYSQEVLEIVLESAFRRMGVTQAVGFLARIEMWRNNLIDPNGDLIKVQVFEHIYGVTGGSHPTMFLANVLISWGYIVMILVFIVYVLVIGGFLNSIKIAGNDNYFLYWNAFIVIFLFEMTDFTYQNAVRLSIVLINLIMVRFLSRYKIRARIT